MPRMLTSTANYVSPRPKDAVTGPSAITYTADQLLQTAHASRYGGVELAPLHSLHLAQLALKTRGGYRLARHTFGLHQGWRGVGEPIPADPDTAVRSLIETPTRMQKLRAAAANRALMPGDTSLQHMQKWMSALGRLPTSFTHVIYPDITGKRETDQKTAKQFPNASIQLTTDIMASWNVDSPDGLVNELGERGLKVHLNTFDLTRQGKTVEGLIDQDKYLPPLLKKDANGKSLVSTLRVGLFRNDFAAVDPARTALSMEEGLALVRGEPLPRKTEASQGGTDGTLAHTFDILRDHDWGRDTTIAAPFDGLAVGTGHTDGLTQGQMTAYHHNLVEGVQGHMDWIPTDYWLPMDRQIA